MNALKAMYKKCMDKDELNRIGATRLIQSIRSFGVWPILEGDEKWRVNDFDLTSLLVHVSQVRGVDVFISYYVTLDSKNVSRRLIEVCQADFHWILLHQCMCVHSSETSPFYPVFTRRSNTEEVSHPSMDFHSHQ
ncbi:hypothetical protein OESDEN_00456 [Oesophagostomum dentatum]|uniref:Peptidase M13 N-terminal domain-containing protein n=1 Tax=Oesophagostomum dentatum TaxID=61180 RepID=A0A0B1TPU2_OESDE|nr:hypothetical protein OESDEN_00456 [Oesophagostomum dentatum]